nr:hypothetical protein [Polymorphobacter sp.]
MISIKARAAVLAALLLVAPALAGPLVVRAIGPSAPGFKPGARLPDNAPLVLKAGDQVTILDARGTRSFSGPGSFRFESVSASAAPTGFTELLTQKPERRARIGAVRGSGGTATGTPVPPGVWAVDAGRTGTVCALDPAKISLWRANPTAAGNVTITRVSGASSPAASATTSVLPFAPGQAVANWPAALPVADGDQFRTTGAGAPATLTIRKLVAPAAIDALGAALLASGCQSQFDRLTTVTKVTDAP